MGAELLVVVGAYLYGSLPFVWAIARLRGVDLRRRRSRNLGGGNLWQSVGPLEGFIGGLGDLSKGIIPIVAGRGLGLSPEAVAGAGLAGIVGQSWPLFLGFSGGRGGAASIGLALMLVPVEFLLALIPMLVGLGFWLASALPALRHLPPEERPRLAVAPSLGVPLGMVVGFAILPLLAIARGQPRAYILACLGILLLLVVRRLTADLRRDLRGAPSKRAILLNRLLFDRSYREGYRHASPGLAPPAADSL